MRVNFCLSIKIKLQYKIKMDSIQNLDYHIMLHALVAIKIIVLIVNKNGMLEKHAEDSKKK